MDASQWKMKKKLKVYFWNIFFIENQEFLYYLKSESFNLIFLKKYILFCSTSSALWDNKFKKIWVKDDDPT